MVTASRSPPSHPGVLTAQDGSDVALAAHVNRRALVRLRRDELEDAVRPRRRDAARLLHDVAHRVQLVEEAQLAAGGGEGRAVAEAAPV